MPRSGDHRVVAVEAENRIVAAIAEQEISPAPGRNHIIAVRRVVAADDRHRLVRVSCVDRIVAFVAEDEAGGKRAKAVISTAGEDGTGAGAGQVHGVVALVSKHETAAFGNGQAVGSEPQDDRVAATEIVDGITTAVAEDDVAAAAAADGIRTVIGVVPAHDGQADGADHVDDVGAFTAEQLHGADAR